MAAYRRVYDSRHLQAECQEPGSALVPYARQSSTGYLYLYLWACVHRNSPLCQHGPTDRRVGALLDVVAYVQARDRRRGTLECNDVCFAPSELLPRSRPSPTVTNIIQTRPPRSAQSHRPPHAIWSSAGNQWRNNGVQVRAGGQSPGPRVPGKKNTNNQNLQLFLLYGRLVYVGETFNRFADLGL